MYQIRELDKDELNLLQTIAEQTVIMRGKRRGTVKRRISCDCYYRRVIRRLYSRGLINLRYDTIFGDGYAITVTGMQLLDCVKEIRCNEF